jgi:hypothetical protein
MKKSNERRKDDVEWQKWTEHLSKTSTLDVPSTQKAKQITATILSISCAD